MESTIQRIIIFAAIIRVFGTLAWAGTTNLPAAISQPNPAQSRQSGQKEPPMEKVNLPNEIPIHMKDFPPLQSMHFDMVPTLQVVPVSNYKDGVKP